MLETSRNELAALRATFERQISSIESRLRAEAHQSAIDATSKILAEVIGDHVERAKQRSETDLTQALTVTACFGRRSRTRSNSCNRRRPTLPRRRRSRKALSAQHRDAVNEKKKVEAQLKNAQQEAEELAVERLELQGKLKELTAAKTLAETQYQQLVAASQKLTDGLSRTLQKQSAQVAPAPAAAPVSVKKKPLPFSGPARNAKRVKIRRGTQVSVEGIPGELVDLSVGELRRWSDRWSSRTISCVWLCRPA